MFGKESKLGMDGRGTRDAGTPVLDAVVAFAEWAHLCLHQDHVDPDTLDTATERLHAAERRLRPNEFVAYAGFCEFYARLRSSERTELPA